MAQFHLFTSLHMVLCAQMWLSTVTQPPGAGWKFDVHEQRQLLLKDITQISKQRKHVEIIVVCPYDP